MIYVYIIAFLICVALSAFFSASEMAFSSANKIRLENLKEDGNKAAAVALKIIEKFNNSLSTILIGNNLVNIAASSVATVFTLEIFGLENGERFSWLTTLIVTVIIIIFGESIPKIRAKKSATEEAKKFAYPIRALSVVLFPLVWLSVKFINLITLPLRQEKADEQDNEEDVEELESIIDTAQDEGVLDSSDSEIIKSAIDFADISAYSVMTARVDLKAMNIDDSWQDKIEFIDNSPYSRIPVYENNRDNIIGVLHLNHFLKKLAELHNNEFDIREILAPPCYVYKTMKLPQVLDILKKAKQHLAIVTDEYSGTLGVITMEDVLEQLVGEIWDETDEIEAEVTRKNEKEYEIDGDMSVNSFAELLNIPEDEFEAESETVGGWVIEKLEKFPQPEDSFTYRNYIITVKEIEELRVLKVRVTLNV